MNCNQSSIKEGYSKTTAYNQRAQKVTEVV